MLRAALFAVSFAAGCAAKPEAPPCDQATAQALIAEAAVAGERCAAAGIPYEECDDVADVNRRKQERHDTCKQRIEED